MGAWSLGWVVEAVEPVVDQHGGRCRQGLRAASTDCSTLTDTTPPLAARPLVVSATSHGQAS